MPRVIDPAIVAMLESDAAFSYALLVDIAFPDPYHLRFTTKLDNIQFGGETYFGLGSLGSVSMPTQDGDLSPAIYEVLLSGISDEILEAVTQLNYMNNKATAYIQFMDSEFNDIATPQVLWQGLTDGATISYGKTSSVTVNIRDRMVDWARPKLAYYNNGDQQKLYPNDKGFEFIAEVNQKDAPWPEGTYLQKTS